MLKWIKRVLILLLLVVFFSSGGYILFTLYQYKADEKAYADAVAQFVHVSYGEKAEKTHDEEDAPEEDEDAAPIDVDFESLQKVNKDVVGWIYCEDTVINYPVLKGGDNDRYLHHTYEGAYSAAGSIFIDCGNRGDFADSNTIIYGHHMKNGSMFASIQNWMNQEFYEEHPVMWLLTPKQNYKILLFSGYSTSAYSDTYEIFSGPGEDLDAYLARAVKLSRFQTDVEPDKNGKFVLLSTCAYMFENARYVLHGMLVPVGG